MGAVLIRRRYDGEYGTEAQKAVLIFMENNVG